MNETPRALTNILNSADVILRNVIVQVKVIVSTPTREWSGLARKRSMEELARTAHDAVLVLDGWMQKDLWIKNIGKFVGCLESIRLTARAASFGQSRCSGRASLKQDVNHMKELLGDGTEFEDETWERQVRAPQITTALPPVKKEGSFMVNPKERPYSISELAVLHNLSRQTVVRLYENEPDVLILEASRLHQEQLGRRYRTIRVPQHVYRRVKHRMENR
jgi:hypothetical protein